MLLNRYARQQRLNPAEQTDPAMRSMMDAVRQVYVVDHHVKDANGEPIPHDDEEPQDSKG